jgi:hypothetical protein
LADEGGFAEVSALRDAEAADLGGAAGLGGLTGFRQLEDLGRIWLTPPQDVEE